MLMGVFARTLALARVHAPANLVSRVMVSLAVKLTVVRQIMEDAMGMHSVPRQVLVKTHANVTRATVEMVCLAQKSTTVFTTMEVATILQCAAMMDQGKAPALANLASDSGASQTCLAARMAKSSRTNVIVRRVGWATTVRSRMHLATRLHAQQLCPSAQQAFRHSPVPIGQVAASVHPLIVFQKNSQRPLKRLMPLGPKRLRLGLRCQRLTAYLTILATQAPTSATVKCQSVSRPPLIVLISLQMSTPASVMRATSVH